jgi:hypothetical protein
MGLVSAVTLEARTGMYAEMIVMALIVIKRAKMLSMAVPFPSRPFAAVVRATCRSLAIQNDCVDCCLPSAAFFPANAPSVVLHSVIRPSSHEACSVRLMCGILRLPHRPNCVEGSATASSALVRPDVLDWRCRLR